MKYENFSPRQKAAYWDTFAHQEQVIDTRSQGDWFVEYRKYRVEDGDMLRYLLFLDGNHVLTLLSADYVTLY